jgi:hypothetical protein
MVMVLFSRLALRRVACRVQATDQAEVASAQTAPIGLKQPLKGSLEIVSRSHRSEIDRFATRAATGEKEREESMHHDH